MSMIANLLRVSDNELKSFLIDSALLEKRVYPDEINNDDKSCIDLDKSWDGIFYCLTGFGTSSIDKVAQPKSWIILGDHIVDENQDLGYGFATYATPEEVKAINLFLQNITETNFTSGFNPQKMLDSELYPQIWDDDDAIDYLIEYFNVMKDFYKSAADKDEAVITFFN